MADAGVWFSAAELAGLALPGMPATQQGVEAMAERRGWADPAREGVWWRKRQKSGGGVEFHLCVLPGEAQIKLVYDVHYAPPTVPDAALQRREDLWRRFDRAKTPAKDRAAAKLRAVQMHDTLVRAGMPVTTAQIEVARHLGVSFNSLGRWRDAVAGFEKHDWWAALVPHHAGRPTSAACSPEAWEALKADFLRPEKPNFSDCYDRVARLAPARGWAVPSRTTLARRMDALPEPAVVLAREGAEALKRLYPAQKRDRAVFHALEAVNLDGHRWDVFVRWPDGSVHRPQMLVIQDLFSGRIMAWRVDQTLHKGLVRLAFGDLVEQFGIPDHCYMDNGRENASKWITGGVPNRFRFSVRDEDPAGLLPLLGVQVHWTTPYSGQSKPIERAFRDFAGGIAKHPAFAGAYVGNKPEAKPENYGASAVPLADFLRVCGEEIVAHNARPGRRSAVCAGRSFDTAFFASFKVAAIRQASASQRNLCLLAAESVRADRRDGAVFLEGNRYWSDELTGLRGQALVVRFDPAALHAPVRLFRLDGEYLGEAPCVAAVGFADQDAAREHGRARRTWMKAQRAALDAERRLSLQAVAAMHAELEKTEPEQPEPTVVRPLFRIDGVHAVAVQPVPQDQDDELSEGERRLLRFAELQRGSTGFRVIEGGDD